MSDSDDAYGSLEAIRKKVEKNVAETQDTKQLIDLLARVSPGTIYDKIAIENAKATVRPQLEAQIRNKVALIFAWAFVVLMVGVVSYVILWALLASPRAGCSEETFKQLAAILQGTFLPVLTLVLGYFFSSKSSS